jgi:ubiquinone biosynthesis protein Coq4
MIQFFKKLFEKFLAIRAFARIVQDPNRLDEVFSLSDRTDQKEALERAAARFAMFPKGERALKECRRLPAYRLEELALLPQDTFGHAFAKHMISRGLDPAAIPTLNANDQAEFVRAHLYETHDIWHVVTGFDTDVAGELGLQAFYMAQVNGPLPPSLLAAGFLNTAFVAPEDSDARMRNITLGWRVGKRAEPFFGTDWDRLWSAPLTEVRAQHGIAPEGVQPELEAEALIMTGIGGIEVYERARARVIADKQAKKLKGAKPELQAQTG